MTERIITKEEVLPLAKEVIVLFRAAIEADPHSQDSFSYEALRNWAREFVKVVENPPSYESVYVADPGDVWYRFMTWKVKAEQLLNK
jgi:hypothetical protein